MDKKKENITNENINTDKVDMTCLPDDKKYDDGPFDPKEVAQDGSYKEHKSPKREDTATDVYYKTECKLPDSKVAIPTKDSVEEAKEWVDEENRR
nr:DUF3787 domain-containing protein [Tissierella sp.]